MYRRRIIKAALCACFLLAFAGAVFLFTRYEQSLCMGVPMVPENFPKGYTPREDLGISGLTFQGEYAAMDLTTGTVYISQHPDTLSSPWELRGKLDTDAEGYSLYFLRTKEMENLPRCVREGIPLKLILVKGTDYREVDVIVSTLPVLRLDGEVTHSDEKGRDVLWGNVTLWNGQKETASVQSSAVRWHLRGGTTAWQEKKPWKLSLMTDSGENRNCDFLGAGADDDWILNPMNMDDTKLREKFAMDLWNSLQTTKKHQTPMSTGAYVEVISGGAYQGLYLLQRRVDGKYLRLDQKRDILLKGMPTWSAEGPEDGYEIVFSPYSEEQTYAILEELLGEDNFFEPDLLNFIDVSLLLNYAVTPDNTGFKNMFYLLKAEEQGYRVSLIPWDTDMSFGIVWKEDFVCDYEKALESVKYRMEYPRMLEKYPDLDRRMAERWKELRGSVYTEPVIRQMLTDSLNAIGDSGAYRRDKMRWGDFYAGEDDRDQMIHFCMERLNWLDAYYASP